MAVNDMPSDRLVALEQEGGFGDDEVAILVRQRKALCPRRQLDFAWRRAESTEPALFDCPAAARGLHVKCQVRVLAREPYCGALSVDSNIGSGPRFTWRWRPSYIRLSRAGIDCGGHRKLASLAADELDGHRVVRDELDDRPPRDAPVF